MDKNSVKLLIFSVEGIKSKRQAKRKLVHVVQTQVCRLPFAVNVTVKMTLHETIRNDDF